MNDRDIGMSPEPPDEPDVFIECAICEAVESLEDATNVYQADHICLKCWNEISHGKKIIIEECQFCHDDFHYKIETETQGTIYMCHDCFRNL